MPERLPDPARRSTTLPILIAGGGIGGVATALALAKYGIASHVFERRAAGAEEGAGIQIGPNGTRILTSLGIADALRPLVAAPEAISVRNGATGKGLVRLPLGRWIEARHGAPYWVAHRQDLHAVLLDRARVEPLVRLSHESAVSDIVVADRVVTIATPDGHAWEGRALVGADGLWSSTRAALFKSPLPGFTGRSALRTVIAAKDAPDEFHVLETGVWLLPGAHAAHYPVRGGREIAIVLIVDDAGGSPGEGWSGDIGADWVSERTRDLHPALRGLLEAAPHWRKRALFELATPRQWSDGPVALLGDAAHPLLPHLAQGAVMALEDAVVLASSIAGGGGNIPGALRDYEQQRRARVQRVVRASKRNGQIFHLDGVMAHARNLALGAISGERIMAGYDWLYGWKGD